MTLLLAQVDAVKPLADGLGSNFLPYALAICLVVIGILAKVLWSTRDSDAKREREHDAELATLRDKKDAEIAALNAQLLSQALGHAGEIRKTLEQVLPLQKQLAEMIHLTDRE